RQIHGFHLHISTYDTFAARTVPPIPLKIRNNDQLPLVPDKLPQNPIRQGKGFVKTSGLKRRLQRVERGLERILVGGRPRQQRSVLVESNERHAVAGA